jgi:hypothetical protein
VAAPLPLGVRQQMRQQSQQTKQVLQQTKQTW